MLFTYDIDKEYHIDEDCYIIEILNERDHPHMSIARARVLPNVKTKSHALKQTTEYYHILSGNGIAYIGTDIFEVRKGDVVKIDPDISQSIHNVGEEDLLFLCICLPRFLPSNYMNLED